MSIENPGNNTNETFPLPMHDRHNAGYGFHLDAYTSHTDPNFLVKVLRGKYDGAEGAEEVEKIKNDYRVLQSLFPGQIPQATFTVSNIDGNMNKLNVVQERIFGEDIPYKMSEWETHTELRPELIKMILKIIDYYVQTYNVESNEGILIDAGSKNFVAGHTAFDPENKIYYVDSGHPLTKRNIESVMGLIRGGLPASITEHEIEEGIKKLRELRIKRHQLLESEYHPLP